MSIRWKSCHRFLLGPCRCFQWNVPTLTPSSPSLRGRRPARHQPVASREPRSPAWSESRSCSCSSGWEMARSGWSGEESGPGPTAEWWDAEKETRNMRLSAWVLSVWNASSGCISPWLLGPIRTLRGNLANQRSVQRLPAFELQQLILLVVKPVSSLALFQVVSGSEVSEGRRAGFRRSGWFHQRGERHAFAESPEPHPPVRHRPHTANEDGKTHTQILKHTQTTKSRHPSNKLDM